MQPSTTPYRLIAAAALALLAAALWWPRGPVRAPTMPGGPAAVAVAPLPALPAVPAQRLDMPHCPLQLGSVHRYTGQAEVAGAVTLRWALQMRGERTDADGTTIVQVAARVTDGAGREQVGPIQLLRLGADCRQLAYGWRVGADLAMARQVQARLALFDFALPQRDGEVVRGEARDDSGRYRFAALRNVAHGKTAVQRRVQAYLSAIGAPAGLLVDGPGLRVELGADFWPTAASLTQTVHQALGGDRSASVGARLTPAVDGADIAGWRAVDGAAGDWMWGNLLADPGLRDTARLGDDPRLHGMPAAEVVRLLSDVDPEGEHVDAALRQLHAWLLANPDGAEQLRLWLHRRSDHYGDDTWARLALAALSRAGTPAARAALRSLAQQAGLAPAMRLHALLNLATADGIDTADLAAVRALAKPGSAAGDGLSANAALSVLGAMARGDSVAPAQRTEIVAELREALHDEASGERLVAAVNGAGNSGAAELIADLQLLGAHADVDVRRRVADAMRAMPQEAAQGQAGWMAAWLQAEQAPQVAAALVAMLQQQWPTSAPLPEALLAAATARLADEANSAVAVQLAQWLGGAAGDSAAAKQALLHRFAQELHRGDNADTAVMQAIGAHVDAKTLVGSM